MAMSQSFRESGSDEANDEVVDICSYCATSQKLQPATHFCVDCGPCGRYICGICLRNHKLFLSGHRAIYIRSQAEVDSYRSQKNKHCQKEVLELKKKDDQQETLLKQQTEEIEKQRKYIRKLESEVKVLETKIHETLERGKKQIMENKKALNEANATIFEHEKELDEIYAEKGLERRSYNPARDTALVAAIDIGSTYSGYAFSFKHDYQDDPSNVSINQNWVAGSMALLSLKAPTVVLFDENKKFHSFGYEAENTYADLALDDEHKWYFFERFKMRLYRKKITQSMLMDDVKGRQLKVTDVFGAVIKYLKDHLLNVLKNKGLKVANEDIHWVLTVPAVWDASAKLLIRKAAQEEADINGQLLSIVTESEAASLYCQLVLTDKISGSEDARSAIARPGTKYMVIDLGGVTTDFSVFERQANGALKVVRTERKDNLGGANVDYSFYKLFTRIIHPSVYQKCIDEDKFGQLNLLRELETRKRTVTPNSSGKITIKVPVAIVQTYKDEMKEDIKEAIDGSTYSGKITWVGDKMRIEAQIFKNLFKPCTDKIVDHIRALLNDPDVRGTHIFLMVGGFSESAMIQDAVKKALPMGKVIIPVEAGLTVLKGAVVYGHRH